MDNEISAGQQEKDKSLDNLERMLEKLPENARKPILDLIHKRKVELGLLKSELKPAGYLLKKGKARQKPDSRPRPKAQIEQSKESLRIIAKNIGKIKEIKEIDFHDVDIIEKPAPKEKKTLQEIDTYKY